MRVTLAAVALVLLNLAGPAIVLSQDHATAQEVVDKVREAATTLSKTGDVTAFTQKQSPWAWKDTYIFVDNCSNMMVAANPMRPEQVGQDFMKLKDTRGNNIFPQGWCDAAKTPSGTWVQYWWPRAGDKEGSRKLAYAMGAAGTPYVVAAGFYDDKATITEVSNLTSKK